jgi:hypothetical protein
LRFLVDAQLPPALARRFETLGHSAEHVSDCGLALALHGPLEELRENCRRMHFAFIGRAPIEEMSLEGIRKSRADGHVLSLVVDSNFDNITGRARALGAISVDVQPMNLRELYLDAVEAGAEDQ